MKLSVIGIGNLGRAIASTLVAAGHDVTVFNRTRAKAEALQDQGMRVAATAPEAIRAADYAILVLFDAASTRGVLEMTETLAALRGKGLINAAAIDPSDAIGLSELVAAHGGRYSDVAVLGYPHAVEQRTCEYVISCHPDDARTWGKIFRGIGSAVYEVGAVGDAQKVVNALALAYAFQTIAVASAVAAFERQRLPIEIAQAVLSSSPMLAFAGAHRLVPAMASRRYGSDQWSVDNMVIVCDQMIGFAEQLHIDPSVLKAIREMYVKASKLGFGSQDVTALYEALNPLP
jgi:3-hydroxyisobutyrate dehydrogenase